MTGRFQTENKGVGRCSHLSDQTQSIQDGDFVLSKISAMVSVSVWTLEMGLATSSFRTVISTVWEMVPHGSS